MSENQNCTRMTRAAAKRKASSMAIDESATVSSKKRVVLGELPNLSNVIAVPVKPNKEKEIQKPVNITKKKQMKKALVDPVTVVETSVEFESRSVDPQMCGPYVSDICAYLREMEVTNFFFVWLL